MCAVSRSLSIPPEPASRQKLSGTEHFRGSGGGISDFFATPRLSKAVQLPPSVNDGGHRRDVPDVAGAEASSPGYRIFVNGLSISKDGIKRSGPSGPALPLLADAERGRPLGFVNRVPLSIAVRGITTGDNCVGNIGYVAGFPWNACTGLRVPEGLALISTTAGLT
jgi:kumamolisin